MRRIPWPAATPNLVRASHRQSSARKVSRHDGRYGGSGPIGLSVHAISLPADKSVLLEGGESLAAEYRKYLFGRGILESSIIMSLEFTMVLHDSID